MNTDIWLGGSDISVEGEWRWIAGPEGKQDGGKGKLFFKDGKSITYTNWGGGEPNNSGGKESYLQWNHRPNQNVPPGIWIDQSVDKSSSTGFFVEYSEL